MPEYVYRTRPGPITTRVQRPGGVTRVRTRLAAPGGGGGGAVNSVNGQTGVVVLDVDDLGFDVATDIEAVVEADTGTPYDVWEPFDDNLSGYLAWLGKRDQENLSLIETTAKTVGSFGIFQTLNGSAPSIPMSRSSAGCFHIVIPGIATEIVLGATPSDDATAWPNGTRIMFWKGNGEDITFAGGGGSTIRTPTGTTAAMGPLYGVVTAVWYADTQEWLLTGDLAGGGSSETERDIYRPILVMSPAAVAGFGGSMVDGVSLTIAAIAAVIPVGADILIWNGTNGAAPNGSYTHTGGGSFAYSDRQYLNATSVSNGCVLVESNDYVTFGSDGFGSTWAIVTANGTTFGLEPRGGYALEASLDLDRYALDTDLAAVADTAVGLAVADQILAGAGTHTGHRFEFPGSTVARLSTPALAGFSTGYEMRAVVIPEIPDIGSSGRWMEIGSQSDDGTGAHDNHEAAIQFGNSAANDSAGDPQIEGKPYLFFESSTDAESTVEVENRLVAAAFLQWGVEVEVMVRVDFDTETLTGWVRVPYELDDDGVYVTSSIDDAIFRQVGSVTDPGYSAIHNSGDDWWIGNNFVGAIKSVVWRDGADGTLVDDVRATDAEPGDTTFTSTGGETWTVGAGVTIVADAEDRLDALEIGGGGTVDVVSNFASGRIAGRTTAGSGDSEELTPAQVRDLLGQGWVTLHNITLASDLGTSASPLSYDVTGSLFKVTVYGNTTRNTPTDGLRMRINGNSGSVYGTDAAALTSEWNVGTLPGSQTNTDRIGYVLVNFGTVAGGMKAGNAESTTLGSTATVGATDADVGLFSTITDAVTSIQLWGNNNALRAGSRIVIEALA